MIPILYDRTEASFESEGVARLAECSRCVVFEERNGIFEIEFDYPVTGKMFAEIEVGRIVCATHDDTQEPQPFDIYRKSEPIGGVVTFYGHHISYRLNEIAVKPFTATSCATAIAGLKTNSVGTNPFTFSTDKNVNAAYKTTTPQSLRGLLGGQENSLLDVYGKGEYKFDKWAVQLLTNRGIARSTSIRYGKNLVDYTNEFDAADTYTAIYPYWFGSVSEGDAEPQDVLITLPEYYITSGESVPSGREVIVPMDLSGEFESQPTVAQLRTRATAMLNDSDAWVPKQTITIDFVALWQTDEYKDVAPLQSVNLCDTVQVVMPMYNTSYRAKVIKTEYNTLLDRYNKLELGDQPSTYAGVITSGLGAQFTVLQQKIQSADAKAEYAASIAGDSSQYFWFKGTGTDTGAHVTQVERDQFEADPTMGGGNLLARSNGMAVRDGLLELATFDSNGISFRDSANVVASFGSDDIGGGQIVFGENGGAYISGGGRVDDDTGYFNLNVYGNASLANSNSDYRTELNMGFDGAVLQATTAGTAVDNTKLTVTNAGVFVDGGGKDRFIRVEGNGRTGEMLAGTNYFGLYDNDETQWLIYSDNNGYARMPLANGLVVQGHNSPIGYALSSVAAARTVSNGTHTAITSLSIPAGSWVVYCSVRFPANASGRRQANLSVTSGSNSSDWMTTPVNGAVTQFAFTKLISHTVAQTFYLNVYQNSGSSMSFQAGSAANYNCIYAVRIA